MAMINDVELRQAENAEVTVGTVSEYDIRVKECVRDCVIDGEPTKVNSAWVGGNITIDVNGSTIKHSFSYLDTIRHRKNGDENKVFKGLLTAFGYNVEYNADAKKLEYTPNGSALIPKIEGKITWLDANGNKLNEKIISGGGSNANRVKATAKLGVQIGLNRDQSDLAFYNDLPTTYISTTNVDDVDSARFTIEGVVKDIVDEYGSNGTTTGRYLVDLAVPNFFDIDLFSFVMLDKWVNNIDGEDIEVTKEMFYVPNGDSFCNIGDTVKLSGDIESHSFGNVQSQATTAKRSFGGGAQTIRSGFTKTEWTIKSGDIVEDGDKYDVDIIKLGLEERDIRLDNEYKTRLEAYKNQSNGGNTAPKSSPKDAKPTSNPFGAKKSTSAFGGGATTKKNPFAQ